MRLRNFYTVIAFIALSGSLIARAQEMDTELGTLAEKLAASIKEHGNKKVTVLDFLDLHGGSSELGKYIAEQLTVNFVAEKREFAVLDRANLKSILDEHKLTTQGLVDPENAKKFGMFAGVDAIILGTITPKGKTIQLTAKIITTETAVIVGAAKATFKSDETVQELLSRATEPMKNRGVGSDDGPNVGKSFGDLRVEIPPLRIVNGSQYLLTLSLKNALSQKSIWVALCNDLFSRVPGVIRDSKGNEFKPVFAQTSGIEADEFQNGGFVKATEIRGGDTIVATVKFESLDLKKPSLGQCNLQLELLLGNDYDGTSGRCTLHNLVMKVEAK